MAWYAQYGEGDWPDGPEGTGQVPDTHKHYADPGVTADVWERLGYVQVSAPGSLIEDETDADQVDPDPVPEPVVQLVKPVRRSRRND